MKPQKTVFYLIFALLPFTSSYSQCNQAETELKEHGWHKEMDARTSDVGAANLPKQQEVVKKIADIIKEFYPRPKGAEIGWYGSFEIRKIEGQYPKAYDATILLQNYKCINNKEVLLAYNSSIFVGVNSPSFMSTDFEMNGKRYTNIKAFYTNKDGYIYFVWDENDKAKREEQWIITYKDKLPFTFLTRKEYVTEARADQAKKYEEKIAYVKKGNKVRPQAEQDAEKQKIMESFKKSYQGDALTQRIEQYNRDHKSDEERLNAALLDTKKYYEPLLKKYDDCLANNSEEYLSQPAIVLPYSREVFYGFDVNKKDEKNYVYILKDNKSYYKNELPVSAPQYISVLIRHNLVGKQDQMFYDAVNKKELLDKLATLLNN